MIRHECLESLAAKMSDQLVVTSQSGQRIEWSHLSKHEGNLLVGMMGCAIGVATGLALALPHRKVIALESDGSVLLSLFNLATLGNLRPKNRKGSVAGGLARHPSVCLLCLAPQGHLRQTPQTEDRKTGLQR